MALKKLKKFLGLNHRPKNPYEKFTDEELTERYVPDVYQDSVNHDDIYEKLINNGIRLISFDIDETLMSRFDNVPDKDIISLFVRLKRMNVCTVLISNNPDQERTDKIAEMLSNTYAIEKDNTAAKKPNNIQFETAREHYRKTHGGEKIDFSQMAHVGNSFRSDIQGAKNLGIVACLVDKVGSAKTKPGDKLVKEELEKRGLWEKKKYYQYGENRNGTK